MITSLKNEKVRLVRALQQRRRNRMREQHMVIEGIRIGAEAARSAVLPSFVLYTPETHDARAAALLDGWRAAGVPCEAVSQAVMDACSVTETPQGLLAVVPIPELPAPPQPTLILVLDQLREPGNLGTILRTALAAGVELLLLAPGTVDVTNPKVVRAGMGAHFRLPIAALEWDEIRRAVAGCRVYLAAAGGATAHTQVDWRGRTALIVGGEAQGAGPQARALADAQVSIPMAGDVESLNAATAAAVLLFEAVRQRSDQLSAGAAIPTTVGEHA